jgi:hypothetical protein
MAVECEVLTSGTLNGLKTAVNSFFATNTKRLVSMSLGIKDGEYAAMLLVWSD